MNPIVAIRDFLRFNETRECSTDTVKIREEGFYM